MRLRLLALLLALSLPFDARAQEPDEADEADAAPPPPARPAERVRFNLEDGDLMDLVQMMTRLTGRRIVVTGPARELRATVASQRDVTAGEAWQAFLAILEQNGLTLVRRGRLYYVEDNENASRRPIPVVTDDDAAGGGERYVTWLHHVAHVPVSDAAQILESFRSPSGRIVTHAPTSTLILVDTGANIARMRRILDAIDVSRGDAHVWVERLHFADAEETAQQVMAVLGEEEETPSARSSPAPRRPARATPQAEAAPTEVGSQGGAQVYRVLAEPRTNALIVVATEDGYRRVIGLLRELDREDGARATVRVHRLQHGDAANVATTMQGLLGLNATQAAGGEGQSLGLQGRVRVEAHADLNALVVTATPADQRAVETLIEELDAPPRQVFLEMVVMELTVDHSNALHVDLLGGIAQLFGTSALGFFHAGVAPPSEDMLNGLLFGVTGDDVSGLTVNGQSIPQYGALIHALSGTTQADILSTPHVLVLDNREATINIGQSVPLQGSSVPGFNPLLTGTDDASAAAATAFASSTSSGGRRDTGTIVEVTPHVNDDGEIRLEIRAEDSRAADSAEGNLNATIFNQSVAETELVAHDGQTVVIGGLMRDQTELVRSGVPILSDIPILGALFGRTEERTVRRNLLFFVTPWVIRAPSDLRAIVERRMRERRELIERQMAFSDDWSPPVDYARARGLVSEILTVLEEEETLAPPAPAPAEHVVRPPIDATPAP